MRLIKCENYEEMSRRAAEFVAAQILLKPDSVLGFPTGETPIGMYRNLAESKVDFSAVTTFNLDEYYPIKRSNTQSYYYFMNQNLYSKVNLKPDHIFIPNGEKEDPEQECRDYEQEIAAHGGIDLQVLGIGQNGHIGFNEPDKMLYPFTHVTGLTENTIEANSRFFRSAAEVPTKALTMGMATILRAKKILLLANGKAKTRVVKELLGGMINPEVPASLLSIHQDVTVLADREALGE